MPSIPIPFTGGQNEDQPFNNVVVGRNSLNMYPETTRSGETILRNAPGFAANIPLATKSSGADGDLITGISVNERIYIARKNGSDADLYEIRPTATPAITYRGKMTGMINCRMATNGLNIVIVNSNTSGAGATASDYAYDIATSTLSTIESLDADYATLGHALDVTYYQGYYFFINTQVVFHGDLRTTANKGLAFNAASFGTLPFANNEGRGIEEVNGQILAFGFDSAYVYNLAGTSPFVLQQQVGTKIDIGIVHPNSKVKYENTIYLYGQGKNEEAEVYALSGLQYSRIGYNDQFRYAAALTETSALFNMFAYKSRGNVMIWMRRGSSYDLFAFNASTPDGGWYLVGGFETSSNRERSSLLSPTIPILYNDTTTAAGLFFPRRPRVFFVHADAGSTDLFVSQYDENYTDISSDVIGSGLVSRYMYTFDYIRQPGGEPLSIKKIRFKLIDSGMTAELQYSDGENDRAGTILDNFSYTSLGAITPNSNGVVEWRRIGRVPTQRTFRIILSNPNNDGLYSSIGGGIVSGEIVV